MSSITLENDPFAAWDRLRSEDPVHWDSDFDGWIIGRYADVSRLLKNTTSLSQAYKQTQFHLLAKNESEEIAEQKMAADSPSAKLTSSWLRFNDPPCHSHFRRLVVDALPYNLSEPTNIERLRPQIQKHVDFLLDRVVERGEMDIVRDLAIPLPFRTQAAIIANTSVEDFTKLFEPIMSGFLNGVRYPFQMNFWTQAAVERSDRAAEQLEEYFSQLIETRRQNPQNDFIGRLLAAQKADKNFSDSVLLQLCVETTVCGVHETSMALIADGIFLLLNSGQFELLKEDPGLASNAVEEVLRCHSPNPLAPRIASETLEVGGKTIEEGQLVFLNIAAANRDPERFDNPERFDITRSGTKNGEMAFGGGPHACDGRPLVRFVAQVVFETLASRLPNLKLQQWPENAHYQLRYQDRSDLYLLESLPVTF